MDQTTLDSIRNMLFVEAEEFSPEDLGITGEPALTNYLNKINVRITNTSIEVEKYKTSLTSLEYILAVALLTAHNMTESDLSKKGKTGLVVEEKINEETIKYAVNKNTHAYSTSNYGNRFYNIVKKLEQKEEDLGLPSFGGFAI